MARLAIFIDGGYLEALARDEFHQWIDFSKLSTEITREVASRTPEPLEWLRTYYYHCLPYQSNPPTAEESKRFSQKRKTFDYVRRLPRHDVREGRLVFRGPDKNGKPIFQQKGVDLLLGLDFALLAGKQKITHAALLAGDADFVPAFTVAKGEGVSVWLFHGPRHSRVTGRSTYSDSLWSAADERVELDSSFVGLVASAPLASGPTP